MAPTTEPHPQVASLFDLAGGQQETRVTDLAAARRGELVHLEGEGWRLWAVGPISGNYWFLADSDPDRSTMLHMILATGGLTP